MSNKDNSPIYQLADLIYDFLDKHQLVEELPKLIKVLESRYNNLPEDEVEVVTAVELDKSTKERIKKWLKKEFDGLEFKFKVKPEILGGVLIRHQDKVLDLSLKYKLNKIKKELGYENK